MTIPPEDVSASLRIAVRNKISLANPLPARQLSVISRMPGVAAVTPFTFFGGKFKDDDSLGFAQFAVDPEKFLQLFGEAKIPADQLEEWKKRSRLVHRRERHREALRSEGRRPGHPGRNDLSRRPRAAASRASTKARSTTRTCGFTTNISMKP